MPEAEHQNLKLFVLPSERYLRLSRFPRPAESNMLDNSRFTIKQENGRLQNLLILTR